MPTLPHMKTRKKKIDYSALNSPLMRIPHIDVDTVRNLLDLGFREIHELDGRAPEVLFEDLKKIKLNIPQSRLYSLRMAVYFAETPDPDPLKLTPWAWKD